MSKPGETASLPIIDISRFRDPAQRPQFLIDLRNAAHEVGFFYVVGHGISEELTEEVAALAKKFFDQPLERKLKIGNINSPQFRGYTPMGTEETAGAHDWREQVDIGQERLAQEINAGDPDWKRLIGPNQWPDILGFKEKVLEWQAQAFHVSQEILRAFAVSLGQPEDYFDAWFDGDAAINMKVVHYPPPPAGTKGESQGVGFHKDYSYTALLRQDDVGGLQVLTEQDELIDVTPIPGSYVFNIGEMLEYVTGGYLQATRHRVISPPAGKHRYSIPFFLGPRFDAVVAPLKLPPDLEKAAKGVSKDRDNPIYAAYGKKAVIGWLRSHPLVAERHWSDVIQRQAQEQDQTHAQTQAPTQAPAPVHAQ